MSWTFARFRRGARAGIPGILMRAEEKDRAVGIKNILRAVAVMHVPIGDQHALDTMFLLCVASRDGHRVEQTEAHTANGSSMMAGRPWDAECVARLAAHYGIHRVEGTARGARRCIQRSRGNNGIPGAQFVEPGGHLTLHQPDVGPAVAQGQLVFGGMPWIQPREFESIQCAESRVESLRTLRMMRTGVMFFTKWIGGQCRLHLPYSRRPKVPGTTFGRCCAFSPDAGAGSKSAIAR